MESEFQGADHEDRLPRRTHLLEVIDGLRVATSKRGDLASRHDLDDQSLYLLRMPSRHSLPKSSRKVLELLVQRHRDQSSA